ncbi:MAG: ferritin-like domain-containing protein [Polyangiaceae bacterium]|nr:ferritin-like domain-containing protein [Polyangiaceae bacterium]
MSALPYDMFDLARSAADARRFERAGAIYHRGQELAWDGRAVLAELVGRHGGVRVPEDKRDALAAVFGPILWGELAAWKISAQLADRLVPLEAKMAATSQAHDEARHFYVMHDYLELALGRAPRAIHPRSERLLELVLRTDDLACKLMGMQLQIETTALTIFQHAREARICPVLSDLLPYFEKDEARHVGLGTQVLPILMRRMGRLDGVRLTAFALELTFALLAANRAMDPSLRALGLDPRRLLTLAKSKQMIVWEEIWQITRKGGATSTEVVGDAISRVMEAVASAMWPPEPGALARARAFARALRAGVDQVETTIAPPAGT